MLEQKQNKIIVKRAEIQTVSYTVKIPKPSLYDTTYSHVYIDVEQDEDGFVHSLTISASTSLDRSAHLSNTMLRALFELFKQERLYVERDEDGC